MTIFLTRVYRTLPGLFFLCLFSNLLQAKELELEELVITNSAGMSVQYQIEVARTPSQMQRGLMFRDSMPEKQGMLFIYEPERPAVMWMKNTILSLDMFFIDSNGYIINIAENTKPFSTDPIRSGGDVRAVLELNAGQASKHQFVVGDKVTHTLFEQ